MRVIARRDANHTDIVGTLRACGCSVLDTASLGNGAPDLVVSFNLSKTLLIEVKDGTKPPSARRLTPDEQKFRDNWKGDYRIIESVDDVINLLRELA